MQRSAIGNASSRLDFLGGMAAFAEALVLQAPIELKTTVLLSEESEESLFFSNAEGLKFQTRLDRFLAAMQVEDRLAACRDWLQEIQAPGWVWHCAGALAAFSQRFRWLPSRGLSFALASRGPDCYRSIMQAGLKIASLRALGKLTGHYHSNADLARAAHEVERRVTGGRAILADMLGMTAGRPGCVQPVDTASDSLLSPIDLPRGIVLVGWPLDDGSLSAYLARSAATLDAFEWARRRFDRDRLREALESPNAFERLLAPALPEASPLEDIGQAVADGKAPYRSSKDTPDPLPLRSVLRFAARENYRASLACHLLASMAHNFKRKAVEHVGELLWQSYADAQGAGISSKTADEIARALAEKGSKQGIYGARLGGRREPEGLVVLADRKALPLLRELAGELGTATAPHTDFVS